MKIAATVPDGWLFEIDFSNHHIFPVLCFGQRAVIAVEVCCAQLRPDRFNRLNAFCDPRLVLASERKA